MVSKALDDRAGRIRSELDEARKLKDEAAQLLAEYESKKQAAEAEAQDIIASAKAEAERLAVEAKTRIEDFVARRTTMAETKIAQAEAQAAADVRSAAAEAAVAVAKDPDRRNQRQAGWRADREDRRRSQTELAGRLA
jgi:F-type H+-transporting ATPase subunit b